MCERQCIFCGTTTPATRMSLIARLMMRMSVVVMEPCCERFLLSESVFQKQAMRDTLPATEQQTQIDNTTMNTTAVTDNDEKDILPMMTTAHLLLNLTMFSVSQK